jgi:S-methylmethionine-dependent homocysteine/selenocysteine methylase
MGRELRFRGVDVPETIWSAGALLTDPDVVRQIHIDYIMAGADIITTNTYGVIRVDLAKIGIQGRFAELTRLACRLAVEARDLAGKNSAIAGSLPPLRGSFRPDLVGPIEEIEGLYDEQAKLMAPHVDFFLCETMSSAAEGRAAVPGRPAGPANRSGWPGPCMRTARAICAAVNPLPMRWRRWKGLPVSGFLANCCAPESVTKAMPQLVAAGGDWIGGYANTFAPVPQDWTLDGDKETDGSAGPAYGVGPRRLRRACGRLAGGRGHGRGRLLRHAAGPYCKNTGFDA